jgi:mannan endo-1,4-beta-mannosidase
MSDHGSVPFAFDSIVALLVVLATAILTTRAGGTTIRVEQLSTSAASPSAREFAESFVTRSGTRLYVGGRPFRFGGANIEWLGVAGYGPFDPNGPRFPSHYEVDDAMATAREMGVRVVRSQTMGDSVGCGPCIEPALGQFNEEAFERIDYALRSARAHGIKIIPTIVGDDARGGGTGCVNLRWRQIFVPNCSITNMPPFWTDATVAGDVERHIKALLDHVNVYTHVAYRNDPTILGWDLLNGGGSPSPWTRRIAQYIRRLDRRHLVLSGPVNAGLRSVDVCVGFVYPHWSQPLAFVRPGIARCKKAKKPFIAYEYGWDRTNYPTLRSLRAFLASLRRAPEIAGDAFWALQAHRDGRGWMPIPADTTDPAAAPVIETGHWWALYYTGIPTLVNTARDMAARAQAIRAHNYAMRGVRVPAHATPPAPTVTSAVNGKVYWQGSAGAVDYTVQRAASSSGPWMTVCRRCVTDLSDGYADPASSGSWYRVIPYNIDGKPGPASAPVRGSTN